MALVRSLEVNERRVQAGLSLTLFCLQRVTYDLIDDSGSLLGALSLWLVDRSRMRHSFHSCAKLSKEHEPRLNFDPFRCMDEVEQV